MGVQSSVPVVPRYARHARGWYAYGARTLLGAPRASCPVPLVRTARRRLVRVARTYSTEAPGRTCKLRSERLLPLLPVRRDLHLRLRLHLLQTGRLSRPRGRDHRGGALLSVSQPLEASHVQVSHARCAVGYPSWRRPETLAQVSCKGGGSCITTARGCPLLPTQRVTPILASRQSWRDARG